MEEKRIVFFKFFPEDLQEEILRYLSFHDFLSLTLVYKGFDSQTLWHKLHLENVDKNDNWRTYRVRNKSTEKFLDVRRYPEIIPVITPPKKYNNSKSLYVCIAITENIIAGRPSKIKLPNETFQQYESHLLKQLEINTINLFKPMIKTPKDLAAALIANFIVNFEAAGHIAWQAGWNTISHIESKDVEEARCKAALESAFNIARNYARGAARFEVWEDAYIAAVNSIRGLARDFIVYPIMSKDLERQPKRFGQLSSRLGNLMILALATQDNFLRQSEIAFKAAKNNLNNSCDFNMSKTEIVDIWQKNTWGTQELKGKPYTKFIEKVVVSLALYVQDP